MAGLGLDEFLGYDRETRRKFVGNWKDDGEIVVWLSTRASFAYPRFVHVFPYIDTFKDDKKGDEVEYLRFGRFVSPDVAEINKNQFFRNDDDTLQFPPVKDPLLLLREWLRDDGCGFGLDDVIFKFVNPKRGEKDVEWTRAELSRLDKRAGWNWNHSLDSKLEYLFVVLVDSAVEDGLQIITGPKLLGDALRKTIEKERDSNGIDEGNPLINPYAFKFRYDKNSRSAMDSYSVARYNRAELSPEILEHISDYDFPSPEQDMYPRKGDKAKLMAAMYDAAEAAGVSLPLDDFFVDAWVDDGPSSGGKSSTSTRQAAGKAGGEPATRPAGRTRQAAGKAGGKAGGEPATRPAGRTRQAGGKAGGEPATRPAGRTLQANGGASAASAVSGGRRRVRKPPAEPMEPCEECGKPLALTATSCECGAQYEIDTDTDAVAPVKDDTVALANGDKCWSCGSEDIKGTVCGGCGIDLGDDLPI